MGTPVAIKRYECKKEHSFKAFLSEIEIFQSIRGHPNIIHFFGGYRNQKYCFIVTELAIHDEIAKHI